eukprot:6448381-Lingulodinium_polyedra.AAC.1
MCAPQNRAAHNLATSRLRGARVDCQLPPSDALRLLAPQARACALRANARPTLTEADLARCAR